MRRIVKLTGTNGSGKTSAVRSIIEMFPSSPITTLARRGGARPEDYLVQLPPTPIDSNRQLIVLGSYSNACGGCDAIQPYARIVEKLRAYTSDPKFKRASILMEGVMISGRGSIGDFFDTLSPRSWRVVYAVMDTPLELCIERVNKRRLARGVSEPVDTTNMTSKHRSRAVEQKKLAAAGFDSILIDHTKPTKHLLSLFGVNIAKEPRHG